MLIETVSLFQESFSGGPLETSIVGRARDRGLLQLRHCDLRNYGEGKWRQVDDKTFGGGPGMVLMPGPLKAALEDLDYTSAHVVYMSPQGTPLTAPKSRELSSHSHMIIIAGHYEGIDQRIIDTYVDEEISIGDFVVTSGCLPAMCLIDSVCRFLPGVMNDRSCDTDSFETGLFDYPHYTVPSEFDGRCVPDVLRSGDHKKIDQWRHQMAFKKTVELRPDLVADHLPQTGAQTILFVADLTAAARFYKKVLGFQSDGGMLTGYGHTIALAEGKLCSQSCLTINVEPAQFDRLAKNIGNHNVLIAKRSQDVVVFGDLDGHIWLIRSTS